MSPESIASYHKNELIDNCLFGIQNCPIPVIIEYPDGEEHPIEKAYLVTGRAAAVKILVNHFLEREDDINKIEKQEDEISELQGEVEELEEALNSWTSNFDGDPEDLKRIWDDIEEAVVRFANEAGMPLDANDALNINKLRQIYENTVDDLKTADEVIGELKLENSAARKEIAELKKRVAMLEEGQGLIVNKFN